MEDSYIKFWTIYDEYPDRMEEIMLDRDIEWSYDENMEEYLEDDEYEGVVREYLNVYGGAIFEVLTPTYEDNEGITNLDSALRSWLK